MAAMGQLNLLREQLSTEMSARIEAENRNKQLLHHNKELLNHLHVLVQHIQELEGRPRDFGERGTIGSTSASPQVSSSFKLNYPDLIRYYSCMLCVACRQKNCRVRISNCSFPPNTGAH